MIAERKIKSAASDNVETQAYDASPIARSFSKESVVQVDSQSPAPTEICRSLSGDFRGASRQTSPGKMWEYVFTKSTCKINLHRAQSSITSDVFRRHCGKIQKASIKILFGE